MKTQSKKLYITRNEGSPNLTKTTLKRTSNAILNMKIVELDAS